MIHAGLQVGALATGIAMDAQHLGRPLEARKAVGIAKLMAAGHQFVAHLEAELRIDVHRPALHDQLEARRVHGLLGIHAPIEGVHQDLPPVPVKMTSFYLNHLGGLMEQLNDDSQPSHVFANNSSFIK